MIDPIPLCRAAPNLVAHLAQLLRDADVTFAVQESASNEITFFVEQADEERARATIGLVLPQLLDGSDHTVHLSRRLVRTEDVEAHSVPDDEDLNEGDAPDADFIPPVPPPLPLPQDAVSRSAWAAAIAGPAILLLTYLLDLPRNLTLLGLALFTGGFVVLVARMPERQRQDDGWDDGAVL